MNEIVVYQPNEVTRLEVRVERNTVWLNQAQLCDLFGVVKSNISYHLTNIFKTGDLVRSATVQEIRTVQTEGGREVSRVVDYFNLDVIISLGFRVNTQKGIQFRQWANKILKEYLANGAAINRREIALADEMDRRLMVHDKRITALEDQVKLIVNAALPLPEKVFLNGEVLDAQAELTRIVKTARRRVILIDNDIDERTLLLLGARANSAPLLLCVAPQAKCRRRNVAERKRFTAPPSLARYLHFPFLLTFFTVCLILPIKKLISSDDSVSTSSGSGMTISANVSPKCLTSLLFFAESPS